MVLILKVHCKDINLTVIKAIVCTALKRLGNPEKRDCSFVSPSTSKIRQQNPLIKKEGLDLQSRPQVIFDEVPLHVAVVQTILPGCGPLGFAGFLTPVSSRRLHGHRCSNIGASVIRIGFWCPLYQNYNKEYR